MKLRYEIVEPSSCYTAFKSRSDQYVSSLDSIWDLPGEGQGADLLFEVTYNVESNASSTERFAAELKKRSFTKMAGDGGK